MTAEPIVLACRFRGALLGLPAGDALGAPVEFRVRGTFPPLTDMVGGGFHNLPPGYWTDDTSMALCLAESLIQMRGFDPADQMARYVRWWREGYNSSTGECFSMGQATREALTRFEATGDPLSGPFNPDAAGNGSLMRLAPVALYYHRDARAAVQYAAQSSLTTHGSPLATDACRYFAALLVGALRGETKETLLNGIYAPQRGFWEGQEPLAPPILEVASGSFKLKEPPEIIGSGYVVKTLEAALWAFHRGHTFEEACLLAANLGGDSDTTAAICGQIAGAYYGEASIPADWLEKLCFSDRIRELADGLHSHP